MKKRYDKDLLMVAEAATLQIGKYFLPSDVIPIQGTSETLYLGNANGKRFIAKKKTYGVGYEILEIEFKDDHIDFPSEYDHMVSGDIPLPSVIKSEAELAAEAAASEADKA